MVKRENLSATLISWQNQDRIRKHLVSVEHARSERQRLLRAFANSAIRRLY